MRFIRKVFTTKILLSGKFSLFVTLQPCIFLFLIIFLYLISTLVVTYNLNIRTCHLTCSSKYIYTLNCLASRNMSSDIWFEMSTSYVRTRHVNGYHTQRWGLIRVVFNLFSFHCDHLKRKKYSNILEYMIITGLLTDIVPCAIM